MNNVKILDSSFYSALRAEFYFYFVKVLLNLTVLHYSLLLITSKAQKASLVKSEK